MKRFAVILLAVLLLTGCTHQQTAEATEPPVPVTEPNSLYMANSSAEQQTDGAVRMYVPKDGTYIDMIAMDGNLVLVSDQTDMTLISSKNGSQLTTIKAGEPATKESLGLQASRCGVSYYRKDGTELVYLNTKLQQELTVQLPEEVRAQHFVSHETQQIYYAKGKEIWALDMPNGISRMIKSLVCQSVELTGCHMEGTVLSCATVNEQGMEELVYIDAVTGQTLQEAKSLLKLWSDGDRFWAEHRDGILCRQIFNTADGALMQFLLEEEVIPAFELNGAYQWAMEDGALQLDFYDFTTGCHSAQTRIVGISEPIAVDADEDYIWILAREGNEEMLYRWDVTASPTGETQSYVQPHHTRDDPDTDGLQRCRDRAAVLEEEYGIRILIGQEAVAVTGGYTLEAEHQVQVFEIMLDQLEQLLYLFPKAFLHDSMARGELHIGFVRGISDGRKMVQFYEKGNGYLILAADTDVWEQFLHGVAYFVDSHVLGNSRDFDTWKKLNPGGFDYDYSYNFYTTHEESEYLSGDTRYFVDAYSMSYPHEDRCRIFVYAISEGNAAYFESAGMQAKLKRICQGIREAYGYERDGNTYLWEQYLNISLTNRTY